MSANNNGKQLKVIKRNIKGKNQYDLIYTNTSGDIQRVNAIPPTGFEAIVIPVFHLSDMSHNQGSPKSNRSIDENNDDISSSDNDVLEELPNFNIHNNSKASCVSSTRDSKRNSSSKVIRTSVQSKKKSIDSVDDVFYDATSSPRTSKISSKSNSIQSPKQSNQMFKMNSNTSNRPETAKVIGEDSLALVAKAIQGVEEIQHGLEHIQDTINLPWDRVHKSKNYQHNIPIADVTVELNNTTAELLNKLSNLMAYIKDEVQSEEVNILSTTSDKLLRSTSRTNPSRNNKKVVRQQNEQGAGSMGIVQSDLAEIKTQIRELCGLLNSSQNNYTTIVRRRGGSNEIVEQGRLMDKTENIKQALDRVSNNLTHDSHQNHLNHQNAYFNSHNSRPTDKYNLNKTVAFADKTVKKVHPDYTSTTSETIKSTAANSYHKDRRHSSTKEVTERNESIHRHGQPHHDKNYFKLNNKFSTDTHFFDEGRESMTKSLGVVTHTIKEENPYLKEILRNVHKTQINDVVNHVGHTSNTNETIMTTEIHHPTGQKEAEKTYTTVRSKRMFHEKSDAGEDTNTQSSKKKKNPNKTLPPDDSDNDDNDDNNKPRSVRHASLSPKSSKAITMQKPRSSLPITKGSAQEKPQQKQQRQLQQNPSKIQRTSTTQTLDSNTKSSLKKEKSPLNSKNKVSVTDSRNKQVKTTASQTPPVKKKVSNKQSSHKTPSKSCVLYRIPPEESDTSSQTSSEKYKQSKDSLRTVKSPINVKPSKGSSLRKPKRSYEKSNRIKSPAHKRIRYNKDAEQSSSAESTDLSPRSSIVSAKSNNRSEPKSIRRSKYSGSGSKASSNQDSISNQLANRKLNEELNRNFGEEALIKTQKYNYGSSTIKTPAALGMEPNLSDKRKRSNTKSNPEKELSTHPDKTIIRQNIKLIAGERGLEDIIIAIVPEENPKNNIKIFNIDVLCRENYVVLGKFWSSEDELRKAKQLGVFNDIFTIYVINSPEAAATTSLDDNNFESESFETVVPNPSYDESNDCYYQNIATETLQTLHNIYVDRFEAAMKVIRVAIEENMQIIATLNQDMEEPEYSLDFYTKDCDLIGTLYLPADDFQTILEQSDIEVNDYENILLNDENVSVNPSNDKDRQGILEEFGTRIMGPFLDDSILTAIDRMIFCLNYIGDCFTFKKY